MEYKEAIDVLLKMIKERQLSAKEKEAVLTAIGTLDAGSLAKSRMKSFIAVKKARRENDLRL